MFDTSRVFNMRFNFSIINLFLRFLYNILISCKGRSIIPIVSNKANRSLWSIESKALIKSIKTTNDYKLWSFRVYNSERREKKPSWQPILGDTPNCKRVPYFFKVFWILVLSIIDISFETTSSKLIPLQLFGCEASSFFDFFFRFLIC